MVVVPRLRWNCFSSSRAELRSLASRFESGSSSRNTTGSRTTAPASATRWRSPPESWRGLPARKRSIPNIFAAPSPLSPVPPLGHADCTQRERDVPFYSEVGVEGIALKHHCYIACARRQVRDHLAVDCDVAFGRPLESGNQAHQCRLTAARGAQQDEKFTFLGE